MPKPNKNETKDEFISRCMGYDDMQKYDQKQRAAICYSYWDRKDETIDMDTFTSILLDEEESSATTTSDVVGLQKRIPHKKKKKKKDDEEDIVRREVGIKREKI